MSDTAEDPNWVVVDDKYNNLLREIELIKSVIIEVHRSSAIQSEGVDRLLGTIDKLKDNIDSTNKEVQDIKEANISSTRFGYIRDYIFPAIGILGVNYPLFLLAGPKLGLMMSTIGYVLLKI